MRWLALPSAAVLLACSASAPPPDASPDGGRPSDAGLDSHLRLPDLSFDLGCEPFNDCIDPGTGCFGHGRCTGVGTAWSCVCTPDGGAPDFGVCTRPPECATAPPGCTGVVYDDATCTCTYTGCDCPAGLDGGPPDAGDIDATFSDGRDFGSSELDATGECGGPSAFTCSAGEICETISCASDAWGACVPIPSTCAGATGGPVCGCDRATYANDCLAHTAGVAIARECACP